MSGDPIGSAESLARLYALADDVADALSCNSYRPAAWHGGAHPDGLPSIDLTVTVTVEWRSHAAD